ncbi:MAG: S9 family peptidase [Dactylosporangium sp.]|nr:S9 family peptidase [Dactylosporangium sp.]NNJ61324.1 S9 family peptidase [Dactylosporangium sp.]
MTSDQPPVAKRVPRERSHHGDTVIDEYAWLADKEDPATTKYLEAENVFTATTTEHLTKLRTTLFEEIKSRTQETDLSVPVRKGRYWYYARTEEGQQYPIHCRRTVRDGELAPPSTAAGTPLPDEQILLDGNVLAGKAEFFALGTLDVSPDGELLAYSADFSGDERFTLSVVNLTTGQLLADEIPNVHYGSAWSLDGSTLFYLTIDDAWRPHRVWRHAIGTPAAADVLIYEEPDERFWVDVGLTRSQQYLLIDISSKVTSEVLAVPADAPTAPARVLIPRRQGVEYSVEHHAGGRFLILHNDGAEDFALASAPVDDPATWTPLIPHHRGTRLIAVDAFASHLVVSLRRDGLTGLRVVPFDGQRLGQARDIAFPEPLHTVGPGYNPEYATTSFRLGYTSMVTPDSVYDCDLVTGELRLRKRKPVLGDFDPERYEQIREWAVADDGTSIPISVVCRRETVRDGLAPCVLYGYGSYEAAMDPWFSVARLSLLDRGVVFAVAHVRGGGEMGRRWYDDGKLLAKKNTFSDFVACARHLATTGWTAPRRLIARGGSAGGLLMGAVANLAPEAFGGIVAQVPFVDTLNSILDPSLPLTVTEWEEWGNPLADPDVYAYMKSYSPYENVAAGHYPPILAVTSINDTRVAFHEPAKWVARLRAETVDPNVLLKTEMGAGHGGPSGRYNAWKEEAFVLAWILDRVGLVS